MSGNPDESKLDIPALNGQVCPFPDGSGRVIMGDDAAQPNPPPGWSILKLDGGAVGSFTATRLTTLRPTYQASDDGVENYGCGFLKDGRLLTTDLGNQAFGPASGQLIVWFEPFDGTSVRYCKLDVAIPAAGGIHVDDQDRVYVAAARPGPGGVFRYSGPFPTGDDAAHGCGSKDSTGAPLADQVQRENPAAEQTFGWTAAEAIGNVNPIVGETERDEFMRNVHTALVTGLRGVEARRTRRDGRSVELSIWAAPVRDAAGQAVGAIALTIDMTARKQTEEALRASQEQLRHAQKMEAVGRLAGGVAHDFNNLLTVISGFSSLLRAQLEKHQAALAHVHEIQHAVDRAATLTGQLLAFSRRQELRLEIVDLNAVVTGMQGMLARLIGPEIELVTDLDPALGRVRADGGQLEQVITNLAVNGIDAMPSGGRLRLSTRNEGSFIVLDVTDTGMGMDEAVRSRLFEPFFTTKERGKGTGLGLSTVYGIVTQSGGQVQVQSRPGAGSTFRVYLPRVEGEALAREAPVSHETTQGNGAIVVVEDDPTILRLVGEVLEGAGYEVHRATDAEHAIALLKMHDGGVRLLLTDVLMPGVTGPQLAERAWALDRDLRVVFMSGFADPASFPPHVAERAAGYLNKPFEPEGLLEKVQQALSSRE